jgi:hypothetical protein
VLFSSLYATMKEDEVWSRAMPYLVASVTYVAGIGVAISLPGGGSKKTAPVPDARPPASTKVVAPLMSPTFGMSSSAEMGMYETTDNESDDDDTMFQSLAFAIGREEETEELARPLLSDAESAI